MIEENAIVALALAAGGLGVVYGLIGAWRVRRPSGADALLAAVHAVGEAAAPIARRGYLVAYLLLFVVLAGLLSPLGTHLGHDELLNWLVKGVCVGAIGAVLAAHLGLKITLAAAARTAHGAETGRAPALGAAFGGSAALGGAVAGLALVGIAGFYGLARDVLPPEVALRAVLGVALGGSLLSLALRLTGADAHPDRIARLVTGSMNTAADLYESYSLVLIAAMLVIKSVFGADSPWVEYPLLVAGLILPATVVAGWFLRVGQRGRIIGALYRGVLVAALLGATAVYYSADIFLAQPGIEPLFDRIGLGGLAAIGLALWVAVMAGAEYYAARNSGPVTQVAAASATGVAGNVVAGLAVGLRSARMPVVALAVTVLAAYSLGGGFSGAGGAGLMAIALVAVWLVSMTGIAVAIAGYGAIAATAAGLIAKTGSTADAVAESLESTAPTAQAMTKGYAGMVAALATVLLFALFSRAFAMPVTIDAANPVILVALLVGGLIPYGYSAMLIETSLREPARKPCGAVLCALFAALLLLIVPGAVLVGIGQQALAALLLGGILVGWLQALALTGSGGVWGGARRCVEAGRFGGRLSGSHDAVLVGDSVGAVTAVALNPILKALALVSLLLAPLTM